MQFKSLSALLRELSSAVAAGTLEQLRADESPLELADLSGIPDDGPWPDYLELHFRDQGSGRRYRLEVETYHGSGGSWGPAE